MGSVPRTQTAVRAVLAAHGIHPSRGRGQNFLVDGNLIDSIARTAAVEAGDSVLEVGTGLGILTDALAGRAARVVSCDVDARLQGITRGLREWPPTVEFVATDVLAGKHRLNPDVIGRWTAGADGLRLRVVSNLPYSIATPFLANLLWSGIAFVDAVVLVQKEAADRFTAPPGGADYGPIAVAVALLAEAEVLRPVPPQVFWPRPKVQSALLRLTRRPGAAAAALRDAGLPALLQDGFRHRRKVLRKSIDPARLEAAGIDPGARAQEVEPAAWARLGPPEH